MCKHLCSHCIKYIQTDLMKKIGRLVFAMMRRRQILNFVLFQKILHCVSVTLSPTIKTKPKRRKTFGKKNISLESSANQQEGRRNRFAIAPPRFWDPHLFFRNHVPDHLKYIKHTIRASRDSEIAFVATAFLLLLRR